MYHTLTIADLFCGIGGFTLAAQSAGLSCTYATDSDPHCQSTYTHNFSAPFKLADIRATRLPTVSTIAEDLSHLSVDILTAGFPCQPFSRAGRRGGFADRQSGGDLFFALLDVIQAVRPPVILLENVAHLQRHDEGRTIATILEKLTQAGYSVRHADLDARDISGLPQHRQRLYLVGFLDHSLASDFQFPPATDNLIPFSSILEEKPAARYYLPVDSPVTCKILAQNPQPGHLYVWRRYYLRQAPALICPTLMAGMGQGGYNVPLIVDSQGLRQLTERECLRLQGFPESFQFPSDLRSARRYSQIGNSVSVPTIRRLFDQILQIIS